MNSEAVEPGSDEARWTDALTELSRMVVGSDSLDVVLRQVTELAKQNLPGAEDVSITVIEANGKPRTVVFTGPLAVELDGHPVRAVGRVLPVAQRTAGGMNVYGTAELGFDAAMVECAEAFAGYAAVAVNNVAEFARLVDHNTHLSVAMETRAVIEQAKSIIMARERCTVEDAFATSAASR